MLARLTPRIFRVCQALLDSRKDEAPHYGDDYWDWALILECFHEVAKLTSEKNPIKPGTIDREMRAFKASVKENARDGLAVGGPLDWYGPATNAAAHRVLKLWADATSQDLSAILDELKELALKPISPKNGSYRRRKIPWKHQAWHLGQVIAEFPEAAKALRTDLYRETLISKLEGAADRVFALARVAQGAIALGDESYLRRALEKLYDCEEDQRPLGEGILGETVKGSLNVLEALWPFLKKQDKENVGTMLNALLEARAQANTFGIVVAVDVEIKAVEECFRSAGAQIIPSGDPLFFNVRHKGCWISVRQGKAHLEAQSALYKLLDTDHVKLVIGSGIAGSLGSRNAEGVFVGPRVGDVVLATSFAPYRIRDKEREIITNAPVPMDGETWMSIPSSPVLFNLAHRASRKVFQGADAPKVIAGTIVSSTGIKDEHEAKLAILKEFAGALAVEEESYVVALMCLTRGVPYAVIRSISDLAEGDKIEKQKTEGLEERHQKMAAENAARLAVATIEKLATLEN